MDMVMIKPTNKEGGDKKLYIPTGALRDLGLTYEMFMQKLGELAVGLDIKGRGDAIVRLGSGTLLSRQDVNNEEEIVILRIKKRNRS